MSTERIIIAVISVLFLAGCGSSSPSGSSNLPEEVEEKIDQVVERAQIRKCWKTVGPLVEDMSKLSRRGINGMKALQSGMKAVQYYEAVKRVEPNYLKAQGSFSCQEVQSPAIFAYLNARRASIRWTGCVKASWRCEESEAAFAAAMKKRITKTAILSERARTTYNGLIDSAPDPKISDILP